MKLLQQNHFYQLENYTIGKNGRLYNSKKLLEHNTKWFVYILTEKGFIRKAQTI